MKVESSIYPKDIEVIGNKKLANFDIEEYITVDDNTMYRYEQLVFVGGASSEAIEKEITKRRMVLAHEYLDSTDWIKSKYVERVIIKKTMTEEEFNLKYSGELAKMDEAIAILNEEA